MKIVCNSSVLITLDNAGILHVLKDLFKEILIPKAVLLLAKREKFIDKVKPLLDEIVSHGFRVADELYQEILIKADEA